MKANYLLILGLVLVWVSQAAIAFPIPCGKDAAPYFTEYKGQELSRNLVRCIKWMQLNRFQRQLANNYYIHEFKNEKGEFVYYNNGSGTTKFSTRYFENSSGQYKYFRRDKNNDNLTFISTKSFENSNGKFHYFRDKYNNDDLTFLSTRQFTNSKGDFFYLRPGRDNDDQTLFSIHSFENSNGKFTYFRTSNNDDSTFLSVKEFKNSSGGYVYFRLANNDDSKTFLSIKNGYIFRDKNKNQISKAQFLGQWVEEFWRPVLSKGLRIVNQEMMSRLPGIQ